MMFNKLKEKFSSNMSVVKKWVILGAALLFATLWIIIAMLAIIIWKLF